MNICNIKMRVVLGIVLILGLGVIAGLSDAADSRGGVFGSEQLGPRQDRTAIMKSSGSRHGVAFTGELVGGDEDGAAVGSGYAGLTLPLIWHLDLDTEALAYHSGDDKFSGAGAHLYWREPKFGLLGLTASVSTVDISATGTLPALTGIHNKTYGIEAELYLGPFAFAVQHGRIQSDLMLYDQQKYTAVDVHLTASKRWYWFAGMRRIVEDTTNRVETGYTLDILDGTPLTIYAGGTWDAFTGQYLGAEFIPWHRSNSHWIGFIELDHGEQRYEAAFIGIRYELGPVANAPMISLFDRVTGGF